MNKRIKHILSPLLAEVKVLTQGEVAQHLSQFPFSSPKSYVELIGLINGIEGEIGPDSWICLFPLEDLAETNEAYKLLMEQIPDYFLIGKDAADTGYAFHKVDGTFHSFGLMSNFKTDSIEFMGRDFYDFFETLYTYRFGSLYSRWLRLIRSFLPWLQRHPY